MFLGRPFPRSCPQAGAHFQFPLGTLQGCHRPVGKCGPAPWGGGFSFTLSFVLGSRRKHPRPQPLLFLSPRARRQVLAQPQNPESSRPERSVTLMGAALTSRKPAGSTSAQTFQAPSDPLHRTGHTAGLATELPFTPGCRHGGHLQGPDLAPSYLLPRTVAAARGILLTSAT